MHNKEEMRNNLGGFHRGATKRLEAKSIYSDCNFPNLGFKKNVLTPNQLVIVRRISNQNLPPRTHCAREFDSDSTTCHVVDRGVPAPVTPHVASLPPTTTPRIGLPPLAIPPLIASPHVAMTAPSLDHQYEKDIVRLNSAYTTWFRQDQVIFSAILGSCSDEIQPLIASASTAKEAWDRLTSNFASKSRSRIISLKSKLAKNPKGNRPVFEFLNEMRSIADELALVQSPIDEEDLLVHIINQLGDEYNNITAALKVRKQPVTYPELFDKLVDFERSLKEVASSTLLIATANVTQRQQGQPISRFEPQSRFTRHH
ncbi:hypothetical protein E3N88_39939 [Mikania micrantha]|uniref:Retrotransposon gag domain-containing protein n=1 Tax=Mikania micrantha TaxID=192012 RepID=A0A5N6LL87_9ASTR|nr:hypothetical protein E3N88_39939 [Mikania micrantha]